MSDTKIFSLGDQGGSSMASVLASLCQNRGLDSNAIAAMMNNRGNGSWGDAWWIIILLIFGWGGFGNGFGNRGGGQGLADLGNLVNNDAGRELLMSAIQNNATAISQLASTLNCDVNSLQASLNNLQTQLCNIGSQVGMSGQQVINAIQAGNASLASQLAQCCCEQRLAVCQQTNTLQNGINNVATGMERGFSSVAYETQRQTCDLRGSIAESTERILAGQRAAEMRELQNKLDAVREENSAYKSSAMTSQIVAQATAPLGNALNDLSSRLAKIECNQIEVAKVPYSPIVGVPTCVAAQYGLTGLNGLGVNGFWG